MPSFSQSSTLKLSQCHPDLVRVCVAVIQIYDVKVITGHRSHAEQEEAFLNGHSQLRAGQSHHNHSPSMAVDLAPWNKTLPHIRWHDVNQWKLMGALVVGVAHGMGIPLRWGGDWDGDWDFRDQSLFDPGHFELVVPAGDGGVLV